jgi:dsDNA-specific endonuclease/ATPase MutS2
MATRTSNRGGNHGVADDSEEAVFVVPIEEAFDLHPYRPAEILEVVNAYLDAAIEAGLREVRLIHGRGKGVQRARVRQFIERDPRVERYEEAPPGRGGWGATLAWLRAADAVERTPGCGSK